MKTMRVLEFLKPIFPADGEETTTVRAGEKWSDALIGEELILRETDGAPFGFAVVTRKFVGPLRAIPQELLDIEHDPECQTREGLERVLTDVYGDGVTEDLIITVLAFRIRG